jgi:glycine/serine hydroxymethyltransferase
MIDQVIQAIHSKEKERLNDDIELIASENYPSQDILDLLG